MKNQNHMIIKIFFPTKNNAKLSEHNSSKVWGYRCGLECGLELGGLASVSVHDMTSQDYTEVDHLQA